MSSRQRILLVDDHQLMLEGLCLALQDKYEIVGALTSGAAVLPACRELLPEAVLLDLSLPDRSGLEILADLQAELPGIRILVITMHADRVIADAAIQSGAHGFVPKDSGMPEVELALETVLEGGRYVSDRIPRHGLGRPYPPGIAVGMAQLTPRQRRIVHLIGEGKRTADIAAEIGVTPPTVTFHRHSIRKALGIETEWGLVKYAILVRMSEEETA